MPAHDAGNVDVMTNTSVVFSEPVRPSTATLFLSPDAGCAPTLDTSGTLLSCNNAPLAPLTNYVVTVPASVTDAVGNPLAAPYTFEFRTSAVADTTRPTIVSISPMDGGVGASTMEPMVVTFSEPMDPAATQSAFAISMPTGVTVSYSWSVDGTTMTATPSAPFAYGQAVRWQINTLAADLAGNRLLTLQSFGFQVRRSTTTTLTPITWGGTDVGVPTGMWVGDNAANQTYVAFLVYTLPAALEVLSASFTATQSTPAGVPFSDGMNPLVIGLEGIPYSAPLDSSEVTATPFCFGTVLQCSAALGCNSSLAFSSSATAFTNTLSSSSFVRVVNTGLGQPNRTFAFRFRRRSTTGLCSPFGSDNDNVGDYVRLFAPTDTQPPSFVVTYTYP
ncbi:MAG: Ig-like domain-containing protein [Myxococcus sp.]|nr:Ig-like domain-containing protein [Myxococcus sp.]